MTNKKLINILKKSQEEFSKNNFLKSISHCRKAIKQFPSITSTYKLLATNYIQLKRFKEAEVTVQQALALNTDIDDELMHLLGCIYNSMEMYEKSLNVLETLFNRTGNTKLLLDIGLNLAALGNFNDARDVYFKLLELDPDNVSAKFNLSTILLYFHDFETAWTLFHSRLQRSELIDKVHWYGNQWQGEPLTNKRVLIWPEQGIGDNFLYCSCFNEAIADAAHCYILCDSRSKALYQHNFPDATIISDIELKSMNGSPFKVDVQILSGSLTYLYRSTIDSFVKQQDLKIPDELVKEKAVQLSNRKLKVGLSWFHGKENNGNEYSMYLDNLLPLLKIDSIEWVNLQFGHWEKEVISIQKKHGIELSSFNDSSAAGDFSSYGALIKNLDLVIAPSNAAFMYAARLGVKSWIFTPIPDYHFGEGEANSLWFNDVKQFCRKNEDNWDNVVASLMQEVQLLLETIR